MCSSHLSLSMVESIIEHKLVPLTNPYQFIIQIGVYSNKFWKLIDNPFPGSLEQYILVLSNIVLFEIIYGQALNEIHITKLPEGVDTLRTDDFHCGHWRTDSQLCRFLAALPQWPFVNSRNHEPAPLIR